MKGIRRLFVAAVVTSAVVMSAACASKTTSGGSDAVQVYFVHGVKLQPVKRTTGGGGSEDAIAALLAGPTDEEQKSGLLTEIPEGTTLRYVRLSDDGSTATVDLSPEFTKTKDPDPVNAEWQQRAAIAQVVRTVAGSSGAKEVVVLAAGKPVAKESPKGLATPSRQKHQEAMHPSEEARHEATAPNVDVDDVNEVQRELIRLKYLPADGGSGTYDYRTKMAIMAFQGWEGLDKDGVVGPQTTAALKTASVPVPAQEDVAQGKSAQVYRDKGVVLLLEGDRLMRAVHTSTGRPGYTTPSGSFAVYQKEKSHWSHAYNVALPYCSFFHGGYAFHEYPEVPAQPASHGCARLPSPEAPPVYEFLEIGTPVFVY